MRSNRSWRARRGFSLIEILVVITIIGLLMGLAFGPVQSAMESGRVTKCMANLRGIGTSMGFYLQRTKGRYPDESGMRFLLTLVKHKEVSGKNTDMFLCPGAGDRNDTGASGEDGSSYDEWETLDSATISYAGRDQDAFPIRGGDESTIVIAADDNEFGPNHKTITNYLFADSSVLSFDLEIDGADILDQYPEFEDLGLPIGPDCPFEPLQVLRVD